LFVIFVIVVVNENFTAKQCPFCRIKRPISSWNEQK